MDRPHSPPLPVQVHGGGLLLLAALCVVAAGRGEAQGAIRISSLPITITQPGRYELASSLELTRPGVAIRIAASEVHLNLAGRDLEGPALAGSIGILAQDVSQLVIEGGRIREFNHGVILDGVSRSVVRNLRVEKNMAHGLALYRDSQENTLDNLLINGNREGIRLSLRSDRNTVSRCRITDNELAGLTVFGGRDNRVAGNDISDNHRYGILLGKAARNNVIGVSAANTCNGNGAYGIIAQSDTRANQLGANHAEGNGRFDLFDDTSEEDQNSWTGNRFRTRGGQGADRIQ